MLTFSDVTEARKREARLARSEEGFRYPFLHPALAGVGLSAQDAEISSMSTTRRSPSTATRAKSSCRCRPFDMRRRRVPRGCASGSPVKARSSAFEPNEWYNRRKDGRILHVEFYGRDIDFDGGPAASPSSIDVTARKEAERLNQRSVETSQDLVFVTDGHGQASHCQPELRRASSAVGRGNDRPQRGQDFMVAGRPRADARADAPGAPRRGQRPISVALPAQGRPLVSLALDGRCGRSRTTATTWSAAT